MKIFIVTVLTLSCILFSVNGKNLHRITRDEKYTTRYDNLDVDRILHSKRLLISYINCLLEKGPCSPEGRELKSKYKIYFFNLNSL